MREIPTLHRRLLLDASTLAAVVSLQRAEAAAQGCVPQSPGSNTYICTSPAGTVTTTQSINTGGNSPPLTITTDPGFSIRTTSGDAIDINATGNFADDATSLIIGARSGGVFGGTAGTGTMGRAGRLGLAIGYGCQTLDDTYGGSGRSDNLRVSVYTLQTLGRIGLSAVGSYTHAWIDTDRATGIGGAHSRRAATQWLGGAQAAIPFQLAGATITPIAGVIVSRLRRHSWSAAGKARALSSHRSRRLAGPIRSSRPTGRCVSRSSESPSSARTLRS